MRDSAHNDGSSQGAAGSHAVADDALGESAKLYRLLVESVRDYAIFALDPQGRVLSWNAGAERIKGYRADEIIGRHISVFYPEEKVEEGFPDYELREAARTGRFEDEGWRVRKDGSFFWANVVITALRDENGTLVGYAKVTRDLSERRRAEEALRESEERLRLLITGVKDYAIYMMDTAGRITTWNDGAERIKGYHADEVIGRSFALFYTDEDRASGKPQHDLEAAAKDGSFEEDGWRVRKDGTRFWANMLLTAVIRNGEIIGFSKVTRDLTERRAAESRALADARRVAREEAARSAAEERSRELRRLTLELAKQATELEARSQEAEFARARADDANRVKSQFLAAMSHELRTPLNVIGGFAELIATGVSGPVSDMQLEQLTRILNSQKHLLGIINDILNFTRIEAGQLSYAVEDVSVRDAVATVAQMIEPQAEKKGLRFEIHHCAKEWSVRADRLKVQQVLLNLLSNALKFTPSGRTISVTCSLDGDDRIAVSVRDTGVGIPADQLEQIFEPFFQVGRTLTGNHEGTGLGLAISRDLARGMSGDLRATSTLGEGSEFVLTLERVKD